MHIVKFKAWAARTLLPSKKTVEWLDAHRMGPFVFTFLSILAKFVAVILFANGHVVTGGLFVILDYLLDGMDGHMARSRC